MAKTYVVVLLQMTPVVVAKKIVMTFLFKKSNFGERKKRESFELDYTHPPSDMHQLVPVPFHEGPIV
jgi:hypothetical protein